MVFKHSLSFLRLHINVGTSLLSCAKFLHLMWALCSAITPTAGALDAFLENHC